LIYFFFDGSCSGIARDGVFWNTLVARRHIITLELIEFLHSAFVNRHSTFLKGEEVKRNNAIVKKKMLDQLDCQMIELLQKDGRVSNTEIAKKIGISEATVRTRLNRLIQQGYIQIVAVSNPIKLGFKIVGNIRIHVEIKKMDAIIKELKRLKPLWFIVQTTGGTGIDTEFVAKSLDELNELIFEKINKIDGVIKTETSLFLNYIKRQYDWGTALY
jgi:Lrp/AsnC family transcriptional regulator for asnA, asnC and gidA